MMVQFHTLEVTNVQPETKHAVAVTFSVPEHLQSLFQHSAGQYLTLKFLIDGVEVRRAYSMCSSPYEKDITIGVKRVKGGLVSNHINDSIQSGSKIEVMQPQGAFVLPKNANSPKVYFLIGGGSGITPLLSIAKTILAESEDQKVALLYANEHEDTIMFREELSQLAAKHPGRLHVEHILHKPTNEWQGRKGLVNESIIQSFVKQHSEDDQPEFFLCGPSGMMDVVEQALLSIDSIRIHRENFVATKPNAPISEASGAAAPDQTNVNVVFDLFGTPGDVTIKSEMTLLDGLLSKGYDVPYSCQSGVCSTCVAKLVKGKVTMDTHDGLDEDELEEGYILACKAKCQTSVVEVLFDY